MLFGKGYEEPTKKVFDKSRILRLGTEGKWCTFTGHRATKLGIRNESNPLCEEIKLGLKREIAIACELGYRNFITGMALGTDTWAAQEVLRFRYIYGMRNETLKLFAAVPFEGQELQWTMSQQTRYQQILANCDGVFYINPSGNSGAYMARNLYMTDHATRLIAVSNGSAGGTLRTINAAIERGMEIRIINCLKDRIMATTTLEY